MDGRLEKRYDLMEQLGLSQLRQRVPNLESMAKI